MGIFKGKTNLKVCKIDTNPFSGSEELLATAAMRTAPKLELAVNLTESAGFASGKILLSTDINDENSLFGDTILLNIRRTGHLIDSGMLKARIQRAEAEYMKQNNMDFVPRSMRKHIREDEIERLSMNAPLTVKGIEFAITDDLVLIASNSDNDIALVIDTLVKELGIIAHPVNRKSTGTECRRQFLTWLYTEQKKESDVTQDIGVFIDGPLELIAKDDEDDVCCTKAKIEGELVTKSEELDQMLREKKLLRKAKISIVKSDRVWHFTFNADTWSFGGLELPEDDRDDFDKRIASIGELHSELENLFNNWKTEVELALGEQRLPFEEKE